MLWTGCRQLATHGLTVCRLRIHSLVFGIVARIDFCQLVCVLKNPTAAQCEDDSRARPTRNRGNLKFVFSICQYFFR